MQPEWDLDAALASVRARVHAACLAAQRAPDEVQLIAVSKGQSADAVARAYAAGQRDFGESYAQELAQKAEQLAHLPALRWHFIGPLQRNKAKQAVAHACMIHSVDSARLASALARAAAAQARALPVLLELNLGGEASKHGARAEQLPELLDAVSAHPELRAVGLMTVPPPDAARACAVFAELRALRDRNNARGLRELSMGMSSDLELAIANGATMVRVGHAIFGPRHV